MRSPLSKDPWFHRYDTTFELQTKILRDYADNQLQWFDWTGFEAVF
jgi:hypothetical protein